VTPRKRADVRAVLGTDAEALVAAYSAWPARTRLAELRGGGADALAAWELPVAFLRLANELEERIDLGSEYCPELAVYVLPLEDLVVCARHLGRTALVDLADAVATANAGHTVPPSLRRTPNLSALVMPRSMTTRVWVRITGAKSPLRRAVRHIPGARHVAYAWRDRHDPAQ
jgi:hypothetical protein